MNYFIIKNIWKIVSDDERIKDNVRVIFLSLLSQNKKWDKPYPTLPYKERKSFFRRNFGPQLIPPLLSNDERISWTIRLCLFCSLRNLKNQCIAALRTYFLSFLDCKRTKDNVQVIFLSLLKKGFGGVLLFLTLTLQAQIGGDNVYEFINLPASARITALGGSLIAVKDRDVTLAYSNPAALNKEMHHALSFNQNFHVASIANGYAAFGQHIEKWNSTLHIGMQYINYGDFQAADEFGNIIGTFDASEYALTLGMGRQLYERMSVGVNLKFISSQFEAYNSFGITSDWSAMYHVEDKGFTATLLFKNAGSQISTYRDDNREDVPFEIQFGVSKKLQYLPFRLSVTMQHLQQWNLLYDNPNAQDNTFFGEAVDTDANDWIDNLFRHFIFGGEFLFGKAEVVALRFGYNHFLKQELSVNGLRSLAGFSGGIGIKIRRFRFSYGIGVYHIGGSANHLTIATNLGEFKK